MRTLPKANVGVVILSMFINFQINTRLAGHEESCSLLIKPLDRVFQVYYQGLLMSIIYKLKGDAWIQVKGALDGQEIENIGKEIDATFLYTH